MKLDVTVVTGPARSGKTSELLDRYAAGLAAAPMGGIGRQLWLSPTSRVAASVRDALGGMAHGCLEPGVATFDDLAKKILLAGGVKTRIIAAVAQREFLRRIIATALKTGVLKFYAAAAERAGFVDMLAEHFRELRHYAIPPSNYLRDAKRGKSPQRQELAHLYAAYDAELTAHNLCDAEGIHWAARSVLAENSCLGLSEFDLIVVDGFTDFTRTEFDLLCLIAPRTKQILISLPADRPREGEAPRIDLFVKTTATLAALKRAFPQLVVRTQLARHASCPAIDHVTEQVFHYPHSSPAPAVLDSLGQIEIVQAAGTHDEVLQIARRIKARLAEQNARPADIVVVYRSLTEVAPRIAEVFTQFAIPFSIESLPRLSTTAVYKSLVALLTFDRDDWPFRQVVSVITNNRLAALAEPDRRAADWLVRDLQVASGRSRLLETIAKLADQLPQLAEFGEHTQRRVAAAAAALPALSQLAAAFDELPAEATPVEWCQALAKLGAALGMSPFSGHASTDVVAWETIAAHFAALERFDIWLGQPPRKLSRRELLEQLIDIGTHESLLRAVDDVGRVRVLSATSARAAPARHLYLAGMSEQAFPQATRAGRLANDGEYEFLASAGKGKSKASTDDAHPLPTRAQDEMLLFYEVLSRAEQSLTISYPAMDDKAQELPPSPYVIELQRIFRSSERKIACARPELSAVPLRDASIHSVQDWRIAAVSRAIVTDGDRRLLAGLLQHPETGSVGQAIDAGLRVVHARARGEAFGAHEGLLTSPAVAASLSQRFGPRHTWSPSQLETYAACPYKFYLNTVLKLEPLGDLVLETDFARRGSLMHEVLAAFHRKYDASSADQWAALWNDDARFENELKSTLSAAVGSSPGEGIQAALLELDRRQIDKWTGQYKSQHAKYDGAWSSFDQPPQPAHFELRFGRKHAGEGDEDSSSTDRAFPLDIGGETVNIAGRIDRIDVGRVGGQTVFNVIDYKSGRRPTLTTEKIESGERLQPALYVMAAQALIFENDQATPMWAGYWSMQGGVNTDKRFSLHCSVKDGTANETWEELKVKVVARIGQIVRAARHGDFPIASRDPHCTSMCDFRTVCRVAQIRSIGKVWSIDDI